jgi:hypothetical protein
VIRDLLRRLARPRPADAPPPPPRAAPVAQLADLLGAHGFPRTIPPEALLAPDPTPIGPGRHALRVLDPAWCADLAASLDALHRAALVAGVPLAAPNTMNRYGAILDTVSEDLPSWMRPPPRLLDLAPLRAHLAPLTASLFPHHHGASLDHHHGFVVRYAMDEDLDLSFHADDAEVTLNLCLAGGFTGGDLWFEGPRCAHHRDHPAWAKERGTWAHLPGVAVLHAGADRHGAHPLRSGVRQNLIVWMRSSRARQPDGPKPEGFESACPPWCEVARSGGP